MHSYALHIAYTRSGLCIVNTRTHETHSRFSSARIGVASQSVPPLVSMLTESPVCEFNKKLCAAAAAALARLPP